MPAAGANPGPSGIPEEDREDRDDEEDEEGDKE